MDNKQYELVIGLEVHMQPTTLSKMFCGCSADIFGKPPNSHVCPVCMGLPGALPVPNIKAIEKVVTLGLAFYCQINLSSKFDRKHYYYPDLPKGYQISQYDLPFCYEGEIELKNGNKIGITRIHMEEDTGRLTHEGGKSLVDLNRSGMPLIELVTEPDFKSLDDINEFTRELRLILRHLHISSADMEKGQLRLEANVSVRKKGETDLPNYKVELKNINSFKFMLRAIEYEFNRQVEILESGETPAQETRGWNEKKNQTFLQRSKEDAEDYRYFPEPDIPPIVLEQSFIDNLKSNLKDLPSLTRQKYIKEYSLSDHEVTTLLDDLDLIDLFEKTIKLKGQVPAKDIAKLLVNTPGTRELTPKDIIAKIVEESADKVSDEGELGAIVQKVIDANPRAIEDYKNGKENSIQFLMGQVMRETKGKADGSVVIPLIKKLIV